MPIFEIGDWVKCISAPDGCRITLDKSYKVLWARASFIRIQSDSGVLNKYLSTRFVQLKVRSWLLKTDE